MRAFPVRDRPVRLVELRARPPEHPELRRHMLYEIDEQLFAEETHHWTQLLFAVCWMAAAVGSFVLFLFATPGTTLLVLTLAAGWAVWSARGHPIRVVVAAGVGAVVLLAAATRYQGDTHLLPLGLALGCAARSYWLFASHHCDVFAVTDKRVLRLRGPLSKKRATVPLHRILDITIEKPLLGRLLGYGHLIFESAAQIQGLRDIRFMTDPDGLDRTIQLLVHGEAPAPPAPVRPPTPPVPAEPTVTVSPAEPTYQWGGRAGGAG